HQVQFFRRPGKKDEPVAGDAGRVELRGECRTVTSCLQADPPQPVARRRRLKRDDLAQRRKGPCTAFFGSFSAIDPILPEGLVALLCHDVLVLFTDGSASRAMCLALVDTVLPKMPG